MFWIAYVAAAHGAALRSKRVGGRFGVKLGLNWLSRGQILALIGFKLAFFGFEMALIGFPFFQNLR